MSGHVFSEIFLHLTWHTDGNVPVLRGEVESLVHRHLQNRCRETKGVFFHGVGGADDHVHLAVQIEPIVVISDLVGELKGSAAYEINRLQGRKILAWQRGYGVVSFGRRNLKWVLEYIANQRKHHASGSIFERLEASSSRGESPAEAGLQEEPAEYGSPT